MLSSKVKGLRLNEKAEVIEEMVKGLGITQLSKKYGVVKSITCKI